MARRTPEDGQTADLYLQRKDDLLSDLDPHLQELVLAHRAGEVPNGRIVSAADGKLKVDVIAKLRNPALDVPGLGVVCTIGDIITGSVAIPDIERVRQHDNVISLKAATRVFSALDTSVQEVRCDGGTLREAFADLGHGVDAKGVIVGIVDEGCDFRHRNFRDGSGSRLLYLWDQRDRNFGERRPVRDIAPVPRGFPYGREFDRARLNNALETADPYAAIDYELEREAHGTHVMDIAAGNGNESGQPGVAPKADLIFVHVTVNDVADEQSLGNSRRLLEAVAYIFKKAEELGRPAVVNLSLGTDGGPHDGTTLVEEAMDWLLDEKPGRAIVIAAGNSYDRRSHAQGSVRSSQPATLAWEILPFDSTPNEMEIWYQSDAGLELTLRAPTGISFGPVALGETHEIRHRTLGRMGRIIHRRNDPNNHSHQIDLLLHTSLPAGTWSVELATRDSQKVDFHAWIERDDNGRSMFSAEQMNPSHTLGSISCGKRTIVVGSYDARDRQLSTFSSEGPTRDGRDKPEVSAPGDGIVAANALGGTVRKWGTSMAAPHVAGLVALLFQAGGPGPLSINEIRRALEESARRNPPAGTGQDARYGRGRIDGVAALRLVRHADLPVVTRRSAGLEQAVSTFLEAEPPNGNVLLPALLARMLSGTFRISVRVDQVEN